MESKKKRLVVLFHQFASNESGIDHWDLMLESGSELLTWSLSECPRPKASISAIRLANHRRTYLEYEGAISENRGRVTRVISGVYEWKPIVESKIAIVAVGQGGAEKPVTTDNPEDWEIKFDPGDAAEGESVLISIRTRSGECLTYESLSD